MKSLPFADDPDWIMTWLHEGNLNMVGFGAYGYGETLTRVFAGAD